MVDNQATEHPLRRGSPNTRSRVDPFSSLTSTPTTHANPTSYLAATKFDPDAFGGIEIDGNQTEPFRILFSPLRLSCMIALSSLGCKTTFMARIEASIFNIQLWRSYSVESQSGGLTDPSVIGSSFVDRPRLEKFRHWLRTLGRSRDMKYSGDGTTGTLLVYC